MSGFFSLVPRIIRLIALLNIFRVIVINISIYFGCGPTRSAVLIAISCGLVTLILNDVRLRTCASTENYE